MKNSNKNDLNATIGNTVLQAGVGCLVINYQT